MFESIFSQIDRVVAQQMEQDRTPGVALALTDREKLLRVATYGLADLAGGRPVTPQTLFEIGSIGKSFTSLALLQLHEAGQVDLHAPFSQYLPWFQAKSRYAPITLHHLMSHTSGLIAGSDFAPDSPYEVWALRDMEVGHAPGEHFHYSNVGYKALGLALERLLNQPYPQIIRERILEPLGMAATAPAITHETRHHLAVGYQGWYDDRPGHPSHPLAPATWLETATGDGCIASTAGDMAAYLRLLMNRGQGPSGPVISSQSFELMSQRIIKAEEDPDSYYGYGLDIEQEAGHLYLGHGGDMVGYYAAILADMDAGLGVVMLSNGPFKPVRTSHTILAMLRAAQQGQPLPPLPPVQPLARVENAADYAGVYRGVAKSLTLVAEGEQLYLQQGNGLLSFEARGDDCFYLNHPDYNRFLWYFRRESESGRVVEAGHGSDWYAHERYTGPTTFDHPAEWAAYPGHYRSHDPWLTNFRVVLRRGELRLVHPWGEEESLLFLDNARFQVGEETHSPERLSFNTVVDGQALRANLSGCDYYRFFTP